MFKEILFVPSVSRTEWVSKLVPNWGAANLKVAGRKFLDYALQYAHRLDAEMMEILDWQYSQEMANRYFDMGHEEKPLFYCKATGPLPRGLKELEGVPSPMTKHLNDGLVVVWGLCLAAHVAKDMKFTPIKPEEVEDTPQGVYRLMGGRWMRVRPSGVTMRNVKAWHMTNMAVLHNAGFFTLPGYSAEHNVYIGRDVVMKHGTVAKPPVLLCDNSWCERNVTLDGSVIVGRGSVIGEGTRLRRTVVGVDTYIGRGLDLENKIVIGKRIIDVETGVWMDMDDEPGIARHISLGFGWLGALWRFFLGRAHLSKRRGG